MKEEIKIKLATAIKDFVTVGLYFWTGDALRQHRFDSFIESFGLFLNDNYPTLKLSDEDLSLNGFDNWITFHAYSFFEYDEAKQIPYLEYNGYEVEFNEEGDAEYSWEENAYTEYGQEPHEQCAEIIFDAFRDKFNKLDGPFPYHWIEKWQGEHASPLEQILKRETGQGYGPRIEKHFFDSLCDYVLYEIIVESQEVS